MGLLLQAFCFPILTTMGNGKEQKIPISLKISFSLKFVPTKDIDYG